MKRNRRIWTMLAAGALAGLLFNPLSRADDKSAASARPEKKTEQAQEGYLGVAIEPIDSWLVEHLRELIGKDEGVRVVAVDEGSPAEMAGLKVNDIIFKYDDQRVYTPEQLHRLVESDKPGRQVTLGVIHQGKSEKRTATLVSRPAGVDVTEEKEFRIEHFPQTSTQEDSDAMWDRFDSIALTRLDNNRFRAEIKYRNDDGKIDSRNFEGTRDEIRRDIKAQKDLPASERDQLLHALRLEDQPWEIRFPMVRVTPDGEMVLWDAGASDHPFMKERF